MPDTDDPDEDEAEGYRIGFIAGYRTVHPLATVADAQEEYLWCVYGHDDTGNLVTLEERNRRIAEDEAR